jgi:hypothetical protein
VEAVANVLLMHRPSRPDGARPSANLGRLASSGSSMLGTALRAA